MSSDSSSHPNGNSSSNSSGSTAPAASTHSTSTSSSSPTPLIAPTPSPSPPRTIEADYGPHPPATPPPPCEDNGKRFVYFAYGSNMLPSMLKLKCVHVHSCRAGYLEDVELRFDLRVSSLVEPSYANLHRVAGKRTHGVVYVMDERDMNTMDRLEGGGRSYVREEFVMTLYPTPGCASSDPETLLVSAYICHPNNLSGLVLEDHPPSKRYLDILRRGARYHKLDESYCQWLENHPHTILPQLKFTPEQEAAIEARCITEEELKEHGWKESHDKTDNNEEWEPLWLSLKGRYGPSWKRHNAGKDMTMFTAGRVATDDATIPTDLTHLLPIHKEYVNATIVDFASQYPIVGHMADRDKYDF